MSWGLTQAARTSVSVSPSSDQTGVIYYQLAGAGTSVPSFSTLKSSVASLVGQNTTNSSPGPSEGANTESDPQTGETWIDFQHRLYKKHLSTTWVGSISMFATTAVQTVTFNWLWAGTSTRFPDISTISVRRALTRLLALKLSRLCRLPTANLSKSSSNRPWPTRSYRRSARSTRMLSV